MYELGLKRNLLSQKFAKLFYMKIPRESYLHKFTKIAEISKC
jgi:hypothetical protein